MVERISDWAKDETICVEGREYNSSHSDPVSHYEGYGSHIFDGVLHPEWFFFRVNERWPEFAIELARDLLLTLNKTVLSEKCQAAFDDAVNLNLTNGALSKHVEEIRLEARENKNFERAIFYLIRWRTGEKKHAAGPFIMMIMDYRKRTGHQNIEAELVEWLHKKIPIEKWIEGLEA